jgi:hypothetical protein
MNTPIVPDLVILSNLTEEEKELAFDEQLMLDREAYYQDSQY